MVVCLNTHVEVENFPAKSYNDTIIYALMDESDSFFIEDDIYDQLLAKERIYKVYGNYNLNFVGQSTTSIRKKRTYNRAIFFEEKLQRQYIEFTTCAFSIGK